MVLRPTSNPDKRGGIHRTTSNVYGQGKTSTTNYNTAKAAYDAYMKQAAMMAQNGGGFGSAGYGGGGGGGGFGYGGGGGGGYKGPDTAKLERNLNSQRDAAKKALPGYLKAYNVGIDAVGKDNAALTKGYGDQINKILAQLQAQAASEQAMLNGDVGAQGGDLSGIRAQAGQNSLMLNNIGGAQNAYNLRLAQIMGAATADRKGMGQAINMAGQSGIDQAYMSALLAIQGMR